MGDEQTALADLKDVPNQGGTDTLAAYHRALILDLLGDNKAADEAYQAGDPRQGRGPARGRCLWPLPRTLGPQG